MAQFLALGMPQGFEWLIIAAVGLLIFGRRLPEVGRSLGKGIVEFKKGLKGIEDDVQQSEQLPPRAQPPQIAPPSQPQAQQYKFDPYTGKPIEQTGGSADRPA